MVFTDPNDRAAAYANQINQTFDAAFTQAPQGSLLKLCQGTTRWRCIGYYGFLLFTLLTAGFSVPWNKFPGGWWSAFRGISWGDLVGQVLDTMWRHQWLPVGLIAAYIIGCVAQSWQRKQLAEFWHSTRQALCQYVEP